jgi:hypothetical protein
MLPSSLHGGIHGDPHSPCPKADAANKTASSYAKS